MISVSAVKNENLGNTGYSHVSYIIRHLQSWSITPNIPTGKGREGVSSAGQRGPPSPDLG